MPSANWALFCSEEFLTNYGEMKLNWWGDDHVTQRCINMKTYHDFHFKNPQFPQSFRHWSYVSLVLKPFCESGLYNMIILHWKFDLRGAQVLQELWLTNCGLVPPRVLVCQHDDLNGRWVADQTTRSSSIVLSFHWGHKEPPGVARRATIVWLEDWNERSTFALEFCGGFVAVGTF